MFKSLLKNQPLNISLDKLIQEIEVSSIEEIGADETMRLLHNHFVKIQGKIKEFEKDLYGFSKKWEESKRTLLKYQSVQKMNEQRVCLSFETRNPSGGFKLLKHQTQFAFIDDVLYMGLVNERNFLYQENLYIPQNKVNGIISK